jgi:hypothetical protein
MSNDESSAVQETQTFQSLRNHATWTKRVLWTAAAVSAIAIGGDVQQRRHPESDSALHVLTGVAQFLLLIVTAFIFIRWIYRAYGNLPSLGRAQRFRPGWAIASWFVPFLNLVRPKQIVDDAWKAGNRLSFSAPMSFHLWWAAFLLANLISNVAARMSFSADTAAEVSAFATAYIVSDAIDVVAAVLAVHVVAAVTDSQERAAADASVPAPAV